MMMTGCGEGHVKKWKYWVIALVLAMILLPLVLGVAQAQTAGNFTVTYISDSETELSWTKDAGFETVMVRATFSRAPVDREDGLEIYNGNGTSATHWTTNTGTSGTIYYRAWSQDAYGVWSDLYASGEANFMSTSFLFLGIIMLAAFLTWFCHRRPDVLITLAASAVWLALFLWLFFSSSPPVGFGETWMTVLMWVFVLLIFLPMLLAMNVAITNEAKGQKWTKYGKPPSKKGPAAYEAYRDKLFLKTRGRRRK